MVLQDYGTIPRDKKNKINEALICILLTMVLEKKYKYTFLSKKPKPIPNTSCLAFEHF